MSKLARVALAVVVGLHAVHAATAQPLPVTTPRSAWGPSGRIHDVRAVARNGDTLYIGGKFTYVGPPTGPLVIADAATGTASVHSLLDGFVGEIAATPDGGWIVDVTELQSGSTPARRGLRRLDSAGNLDPSWFVDCPGQIYFLIVDGSTVYFGGFISTVNGQPRASVAAVDLESGSLLPWNPGYPGGVVRNALLHRGTLYLAGYPGGPAGPPAAFIAVDASTGATAPGPLGPLEQVRAMAAIDDTLYLIGPTDSSTTAGFRDAGVRVTISSGAVVPWDIPPTFAVATRLHATAQRMFLEDDGGVQPFDPATGAAVGPPLQASTVGLGANSLFTGHLEYVNDPEEGEFRYVLTARSLTTLAPQFVINTSRTVAGISENGGRLAIGGAFRSYGGVPRDNLYALDLKTGRPTDFAPRLTASVTALEIVGRLLAVGQLSHGLRAIDRETGATVASPIPVGDVMALAVNGSELYVGGESLATVGGVSRPSLLSFSLTSGQATAWQPNRAERVTSLAVVGDAVVVGGVPNVAYRRGDNALVPWTPMRSGDLVGASAAHVAVVAPPTPPLPARPFVGAYGASGQFVSLDVPSRLTAVTSIAGFGDQFVVGGTTAGSSPVAILSALSGADLDWAPALQYFDLDGSHVVHVWKMARYRDMTVVLGYMDRAGGHRVMNVAVFPTSGAPPPRRIRPQVVGQSVSLDWDPPAATTPQSYRLDVMTGATPLGPLPVATNSVAVTAAPGSYTVGISAVVDGIVGVPSAPLQITVPAPATPPPVPMSLVATSTAGAARLTWSHGTGPGNVESYVIEAGTQPGAANLAAFDTGHVDTEFAAPVPSGTYVVRVRARNAFGVSAPSAEVTLVVP